MTHPPAELHMDLESARALVAAECPELNAEPFLPAAEGWDNFMFRIGERRALRLPKRAAAVPLLVNEQRWLPILAERLPVAVPFPLFAGRPCRHFNWPWSVVRWIDGDTAEKHRFGDRDADLLAQTLRALHRPAPPDAPANPFRGVPLESRSAAFQERLDRLRNRPGVNATRLAKIWRRACSLPAETKRRWLHGDLHPRNVVVRDGSLAGLIDWGDLCGGDVATDLACAWTLIESSAGRAKFLKAYGATGSATARAMGWAANLGLAMLESAEPGHVEIGAATLGRIAGDA